MFFDIVKMFFDVVKCPFGGLKKAAKKGMFTFALIQFWLDWLCYQ